MSRKPPQPKPGKNVAKKILVDEKRDPVDIGPKARKKASSAKSGKTDVVYTPKVFPRAALFKAADARTKRVNHHEFTEVFSARDVVLRFKGPDLHIFDFLVWTQVAKHIRNSATKLPDGTLVYGSITISMRSLCLLVGIAVNNCSYTRLKDSLKALWDVEFELVQYNWSLPRPERTTDRLKMLSGMGIREQLASDSKKWQAQDVRLHLAPGIFELFLPGHYFSLDANALKGLIKSPLSAWLYAHLATHDNFSKGMRYETIQKLAGIGDKPLYEVRRVVKAAIRALEKEGYITDVDLSNQTKFLLRPLIKKLKPSAIEQQAPPQPSSVDVANVFSPKTYPKPIMLGTAPEEPCRVDRPTFEQVTENGIEGISLSIAPLGDIEIRGLLRTFPTWYANREDLPAVLAEIRRIAIEERGLSANNLFRC